MLPAYKSTWAKLATATTASLVALALPCYLIPQASAIQTVKFWGYWLMLLTCTCFLWQVWRVCRQGTGKPLRSRLSRHGPGLLLAAMLAGFLHTQDEAGFKILYDEHLLSSTAMNLHSQQLAYVQAAVHYIDGERVASLGHVDKRPLLFPFLLSAVHNVFGYDYKQVFALNTALTFVMLALLYVLLARLTNRCYAWLGLLLLGGLPLLAQNANGGGYEILNLSLILGLALAAIHYFQQEDDRAALDLLIMTAILLANVRYESILYVLVPAAVFLLKSLHRRTLTLTWFSVCSPLFLILPLLSLAIFRNEPLFFHTTPENFFRFSHLPGNLGQALVYLFDWNHDYSNSLLLSVGGLISLPALLVLVTPRLLQYNRQCDALVPLVPLILVILINTGLALASYWGAWTDPITARFSLPLQLAMVLCTSLLLFRVLHQTNKTWLRSTAPGALLLLAAAYLVIITPAHCERMRREPRLAIAAGYSWVLDWITHHAPAGNHLYLAQSTAGIGLLPVGAIPLSAANAAPKDIIALKTGGMYDQIFVVEALVARAGSSAQALPGHRTPDRAFQLETCAQIFLTDDFLYRISRLTTGEP